MSPLEKKSISGASSHEALFSIPFNGRLLKCLTSGMLKPRTILAMFTFTTQSPLPRSHNVPKNPKRCCEHSRRSHARVTCPKHIYQKFCFQQAMPKTFIPTKGPSEHLKSSPYPVPKGFYRLLVGKGPKEHPKITQPSNHLLPAGLPTSEAGYPGAPDSKASRAVSKASLSRTPVTSQGGMLGFVFCFFSKKHVFGGIWWVLPGVFGVILEGFYCAFVVVWYDDGCFS